MRGEVGKIFGETSAYEFEFVIFNPRDVRRGDYIKVWNDVEGWVVAYVTDIRAKSDMSGEDVIKGRNVDSEIYVGKAVVIGKRENGVLKAPRTPFVPGEKVFIAEEEIVSEVLGMSSDGAYLGLLGDTSIKVKLDVNSLVQKHVCILAKTGSGKSYTAGVIIEELIEKGVPLLIIDPHGEYASLKHPNDVRDEIEKMEEFGIKPKGYGNIRIYVPPGSPFADRADGIFYLDGRNLEAEEVIELGNITSPAAQALLYQVIRELEGDYTIDDIISKVEEIKNSSKPVLLGALIKIQKSGLFSDSPTPMHILLQKGRAVILDMRGVDPSYQDLIVARVCSELFEMRKREEIPPGMIVLEEAHNFIPERGYGKAVSTQVLRTIASEGRKFGLGLMVISQRPARVDKNVISQCNTQIILRLTNPNDINAIKKGVEGLTAEMVEDVKRLPPGNAIVVSPELERPVIVRVRVRKSRHGHAVEIFETKSGKSAKRGKKRDSGEKKSDGGLLKKIFGG
ncbi:helicase HerA domain-containing protein [Geoglobus acetivorans]|uniref:HerA helicase n=1 Tax=Geoglobus acetivorans TaxID=565033 RepID=A0A0A7GJQ7_GEOAI|nr:HerA helicase [Geoglobus acetivorans]